MIWITGSIAAPPTILVDFSIPHLHPLIVTGPEVGDGADDGAGAVVGAGADDGAGAVDAKDWNVIDKCSKGLKGENENVQVTNAYLYS